MSSNLDDAISTLRRVADQISSTSSSLISSASGSSASRASSSSVSEEHRRLFNRTMRLNPYRSRSGRTDNNLVRIDGRKKGRTMTRSFVCLSSNTSTAIPSMEERRILRKNGLGEKRVTIPTDALHDQVRQAILSSFPALDQCGGFELLTLKSNSKRVLTTVSLGRCSAEDIREFGTGRIYIRPIQKSIAIIDIEDSFEEQEKCLSCSSMVPIKDLREHMQTCQNSGEDAGLIEMFNDDPANASQQRGVVTTHNTSTVEPPLLNTGDLRQQDTVVATFPSSVTHEHAGIEATVVRTSEGHGAESRNTHPPDEATQHSNSDGLHSCLVHNMANILEEVNNIHDPVAVLRHYQKCVMTGRQLDQSSLTETLEGETQPIYVSRMNLFTTAIEEILEATNLLVPLEVTFYGEEASDLGGPRKEFLTLFMKEMIKDEWRLFEMTEDGTYKLKDDSGGVEKKYYFGAGLVCGLSLMQNGPLPCFLSEQELEALLSQNLSPGQAQFRDGLNRLGFVDLMRQKPCVTYLFRPSARSPLTQRKLIHVLKPVFSDIGSNRRLKEDATYQKFIAYLREVSGGRRGTEKAKVTLDKILQFVTASAEIPVLGYYMPPKIEFFDDGSMLPRSSTCINVLYLPLGHLPDDTALFSFFDYAFLNEYFGKM